jgi:HEPN domain-containing protein
VETGAADYREAAVNNLEAAVSAHELGLYVVSHYLSGLAVECLLRAYRWRIDPKWDGRHNLARLLLESGLNQIVSAAAQDEFAKHFTEVARRWRSEHRYSSNAKMIRFLNDLHATVNVKGDKLKENSRIMLSAANYLLGLSERKWNQR